jgi:glutamate-1-semialdehyde 2,1-aminomutase
MDANDRARPGTRSARLWDEVLQIIPWGTQTNSKRPIPALKDVMPLFIERAHGCRIIDPDGREYIDYRSSQGPIILGHGFPSVQTAVRSQLELGVLFSMASPLELEVARAIRDMVPHVEMVRFLKTGGDAISACVRLARAITERDRIVITGYHGWHDAFASPKSAGIPSVIRDLTLRCPYGDNDALAQIFARHGEEIAAVVTQPYDGGPDATGVFPSKAKEVTQQFGALLIFDEIVTGFRLARGGGAEFFGVAPDLVAYAKAFANGFPLAAFAGRAKYMNALDRTLITTTYGGETLSLAASLATLRTMREEPVHKEIWQRGSDLMEGLASIMRAHDLPGRIIGLPPHFKLVFLSGDDERDKHLYNSFYGSLFRHGVFSDGFWILSYAHQKNDLEETLAAATIAAKESAGVFARSNQSE